MPDAHRGGLGSEYTSGLVIFMRVDRPVREHDIGSCLFDVSYHLIDPFIINHSMAVDLTEEVRFDVQELAGGFGFFRANGSCFGL